MAQELRHETIKTVELQHRNFEAIRPAATRHKVISFFRFRAKIRTISFFLELNPPPCIFCETRDFHPDSAQMAKQSMSLNRHPDQKQKKRGGGGCHDHPMQEIHEKMKRKSTGGKNKHLLAPELVLLLCLGDRPVLIKKESRNRFRFFYFSFKSEGKKNVLEPSLKYETRKKKKCIQVPHLELLHVPRGVFSSSLRGSNCKSQLQLEFESPCFWCVASLLFAGVGKGRDDMFLVSGKERWR